MKGGGGGARRALISALMSAALNDRPQASWTSSCSPTGASSPSAPTKWWRNWRTSSSRSSAPRRGGSASGAGGGHFREWDRALPGGRRFRIGYAFTGSGVRFRCRDGYFRGEETSGLGGIQSGVSTSGARGWTLLWAGLCASGAGAFPVGGVPILGVPKMPRPPPPRHPSAFLFLLFLSLPLRRRPTEEGGGGGTFRYPGGGAPLGWDPPLPPRFPLPRGGGRGEGGRLVPAPLRRPPPGNPRAAGPPAPPSWLWGGGREGGFQLKLRRPRCCNDPPVGPPPIPTTPRSTT